ncbi:hypothetical protein N7320_02060 [Stutzerimonas stutzeri]|uniref:hypothetical protein n=1 Tax=Stutzerimonas stutzeri TaxID=316 RepID=UPI002447C497|nr:hypothetical protein [Stutzerimonas stutzeri]MDH0100098.1 hypothetical protein [Stutzerimonas stutzeri]
MADQLAPRRKRKERRHILFRVERAVVESTGELVGALVPRFATDRRLMRDRGYRMGDDLRAELSKPRHLGQHRRAHLLGGLAVAQLEGFEGLDQHAAIKRLQRESGVCCEVEQIDAAPVVTAILAAAETMLGAAATRMLKAVLPEIKQIDVLVPQSLAFDRMEQGEFELFYAGICQHLAERYWPDCDQEQIEQMAELMDRERAA